MDIKLDRNRDKKIETDKEHIKNLIFFIENNVKKRAILFLIIN